MSNIGGSGGPKVDHSLDGQSQVTYIVSILSLATVISTAVVVLRIFTRARILRTFGLDDAVMGVAQILTIGAAVAIGLGMSFSRSPFSLLSRRGTSPRGCSGYILSSRDYYELVF